MELFVARQPIFDIHQNVYGYELLYRSQRGNYYDGSDGDQASFSVIHNIFFLIGLENLTGGKKAFINFTKNLLVNDIAFSLPKEFLVIEVLENIEPDELIISTCTELKKSGYVLALDDFVMKNNFFNPLVELADIIKVDLRESRAEEMKEIAQQFASKGIKLLAEKTETLEEFKLAREMGYVYFQGYFFSKPIIISRKDIPSNKINHLQMLQEINREDLDLGSLEKIIKRDTSLTYKLLKYINSAFFGLRQPITSIKHALVLLGEYEVRKWASLILLTSIGQDKPAEILITSLVRAKFCESLVSEAAFKGKESALFLLGMFSMIDVLISRPMDEILEEILLPEDVKVALLGGENRYRDMLELALSYERGDWQFFSQYVSKLSLDEDKIPDLYLNSIDWAEKSLKFSQL